jgi:hypothetical protein
MGRTRANRSGQRRILQRANGQHRALQPNHANCTLAADFFRPRLEVLEQRLYPGDVLLGVWALTLGGQHLNSFSPNELSGALRAGDGSSRFDASGAAADALAPLSFLDDVAAAGQRPASVGDRTATASTFGSASVFDGPSFAEDSSAQSTIALPISGAAPALWTGIPAGMGGAWSDASASFFALAAAGNGERAGGAAGFLAAAHGSSAPLAFDAASGQLAIREDGGEHTVRESITGDGFVDVTLDGLEHSSNPRSASFDRALAGATGATVTGIRFAGGSQDTLTLGSQQVAGGLTVQATGATVVTQNVAAAGSLAIQAPNITVNGAVQGSSVSLAASGWVTVNAAGRVQSVPAASGGSIAVAADVFVNSGQLHADGTAGGSITIQTRNLLNAGPITADSTGPGLPAGQVGIAFTGAYVATTAAVMSASSTTGLGGQLTIDGGNTGHLFTSGRQLATGSVGGTVDLLGQGIILSAATVDVSGQAGGGLVGIGGDFQGGNLALGNADTVTVTPASTIRADALRGGGGGRVSVRADQTTEFDGTVSARGGPVGGSGGFIDLSGQGNLTYGGSADAGARFGKSGTLLLDPKNITISAAPAGVFPQFDLIDPHHTSGGEFGSQYQGVTVLANGNIVVTNPTDNFGGRNAGAVYLFDGLSGALISSLVGSHSYDQVGFSGITSLSNGNYVVDNPGWNNNRGAVTWGNGSTGTSGTISDANSLVGSNPGDMVGYFGITPLSNGNYVVNSANYWNGNRGAVTWGNGSTGISGTVSEANSLVGSNPGTGNIYSDPNPGDLVGYGGVTPLSSGNYVIDSQYWNSKRGAVTWGNGNTGVSGAVTDANSLVGSNPGDYVGDRYGQNFGGRLSNGNYLIQSPNWHGNRGAVTWGSGSTGVSGTISADNSFIGSNPSDQSGNPGDQVGYWITSLNNGNYVVASGRGATWASGTSGQTQDGLNTITPQNTLLGVGSGPAIIDDPIDQSFVATGNGRVTVGLPDPNLFSYARGQAQSVTFTPQFLTNTLNNGTAVVLQASNDITVNSPITVSAGGNGGALTLQAGRSIVLNGNITTDSGALTLIANDEPANGVVDAERDPGNAVITMAPGTNLDTGSGRLTVELNDGAGLTNSTSGAITLQTVTAGSVSVINNGPSAGSDVNLGSVTASGEQNYADPNGTTMVSGNLTAANPITFNDSVVVQNGVSIDAGYGTVNFVGSRRQQLTSGAGATFGNVLHNGSGTLQLTSGLTVQGTFETVSGTFDANNQPVTVGGMTIVAGASTYLAGTAPQSLQGRLVILAGVFTSSTGPMSISGGTILTGDQTSYGLLTGVGTVDALTTLCGTLAPGGASPGILSITGALALNPFTTVSLLLNGPDAGTGYSQLQVGGPIDLGQSTLSLNLGLTPPVGSSFEILTNTGATPIPDTFAGLAEGAVFSQGSSQFQITYQGGTGGDSVVLTCLA